MKVSLLLIKNSIGSWRRWRNHSLPMNKSPIPHLFHHFSLHTCTQATSWPDGVPGLFISSLQISWFSYMLVFSASSLHLIVHATCRMWEFSVGLYMINIWPESLLLAAVYGVVESSSTALLGPIIGEWVDKLTYLKVLTLALTISPQRFSLNPRCCSQFPLRSRRNVFLLETEWLVMVDITNCCKSLS